MIMGSIVSTVTLRIVKWAHARKKISGLKIDKILRNWGACLIVGSWCPLPIKVLKSNVDGAA